MKILIACEYSGRVRDAFLKMGHDAISCDILPTDVEGPHFQGDVRIMLDKEWDMIIAHPPCTFLTNAGARWLYEKPGRWGEMEMACDFFNLFLDHPAKKKCVENPVMHGHAKKLIRRDFTQSIQPHQFGHPENKRTCLHLDGLPNLIPSNDVREIMKTMTYAEKNKVHHCAPGPNRWKIRSTTYQGVADAMASQWGK
jgi:hypothetical protein